MTGASLPRFLLVLALAVLAALLLPQVANRGIVFLGGIVAVNVVFGMAFNLLFSTAGLLSFGQATYFAVGAYATALLVLRLPELPFLLTLVLAAAIGGLVAFAIGILALRRAAGVAFAVLTLAFGELIHVVITKTTALGRNDGLTGIARPEVFGWNLQAGDSYYYFMILVVALLIALLWWVGHGRLGRSFLAVKLDPTRAAFLGIDVRRRRLQAFVVAGAATAAAGALFAPWAQIVTPELAHWSQSTKPILFTLLGGAGFFWGPLVGAVLFGVLEYVTRTLVGLSDLVTGGLLLLVVLAVPGGILGLAAALARRLRRRTSP